MCHNGAARAVPNGQSSSSASFSCEGAPGASGMTIRRFVFLRRDYERGGGRALLAHQLVHVRQYAEAGTIRFLLGYLRDYVGALRRLRNHRAAYLAIPAEAEALAEAEAWAARS